MNISRSALVLAAVFAATPALAQDEESNFGGPYLGAVVGYDSVRLGDGTDSGSEDGVVYAGVFGYDFDLGKTVIGAEAELGDSSVKATESDLFAGGDQTSLSAGYDIYLGARVGFKAGDRTLIYAKAGYSATRLELAYDDGVSPVITEDDTIEGYRLGAGAQFALTPKIGLRAEYRFSDYGAVSFQGVDTGISAQRHQVVATLVGKF